ncbi:type II secretion system secretin GspD [Ectopseudomonas hydrolytica]|uniref:type II secretion system secretin GspD n=1 Tax=Ectopseudomonas hydrolytica TaxID=2493633 RepID=UPI0018A6ECAE|nr:type II secretion system secretin GspD [Pseudomonas hydrolytica]MBF8162103.1 type II secretion system secretin GspD [Pseudomonas mendocina]UTH31269.1 type II secretion system secretin GspD [Pseudomonas hydrolytica]UZZ10470.1 type II secretion system secretin GspD [Pseudomonas mendocina]
MPILSRLLRTLCCAALLLVLAGQAHATAVQPGRSEESWTVNMQGADIRDFIEQISSISGQTFIIDPRVKGQVTVIAQEPMGLAELYKLFLSVMTTHGFAVMPQGDQLSIMPNAEARSSAGSQGNLETRVLQVQHGAANDLLPMIRPLVANHGHLAAVPSSNSLIISDAPANIERIGDLIRQLDDRSQDNFSVYELKHAWVSDLANLLGASLQNAQAGGAQVIADPRSNRLLLLGPREARLRLLKLAQSLDTPSSRSANTRVIRLRHADAKQLAETLGDFGDNLSQSQGNQSSTPLKLMIRADQSLNAIVIMAEADMVSLFEDLVRQLDAPRAQVLVEAAIVEMSGDINDALGVQWAIDGRHNALGGVNFSNTGLSIGTLLGAIARDETAELAKTLPNGAIFGLGNDNFGMLITALSATGKSNLLSTPTLLTLDNQPAEILVGQNVPFQTGSYTTDASGAGNPFTTIERKDIGVTLKVTPHINDGATLRLVIEQEISSIAPSTGLNAQAVDLVTNKRSIKSTVLADDGQVIVLGGLIQDDTSASASKVPLLGDIPGVGRLFRSTRDARQKRNLMVFLRPSVARDGVGLANLSLGKYRDLRLLGQASGYHHLPPQAHDLFSQDAATPVTDLRQPQLQPAQPQPQPQPQRSLIETPRPVDPASLGDGQGGDVATARAHERYTIRLIEGESQAFMQALLGRHPDQPLRLQQHESGTRYALLYGSYPNRELALKALAHLPEQLPSRTAAAIPE